MCEQPTEKGQTLPATIPKPPHVETEDGVIRDARRRQRRRHARSLAAFTVLALLAGLGWMLSGASSKASPSAHLADDAGAGRPRAVHGSAFNVRLYPMMTVGVAGYCEAVEEHGVTGGSACGAVPTLGEPFTMVYGFGEGSRSTTVAVTIPEVTSILVNGVRRVPTTTVPGLPYGLRVARIETTSTEPLPPAMRQAVRREGTVLVAFDAQGRRLPDDRNRSQRQSDVGTWHYPSRPPEGACGLRAAGLAGLSARGGAVARDVRPFPGDIVGQAFLPCVETEYVLHGEPVRAWVLLNAADPSAPAATMPNFTPARGEPGFFTEGGTLTARRQGDVWLVAAQGTGLGQRIELLRHLTAHAGPNA